MSTNIHEEKKRLDEKVGEIHEQCTCTHQCFPKCSIKCANYFIILKEIINHHIRKTILSEARFMQMIVMRL